MVTNPLGAEFFIYHPSDRTALEAALDRCRSGTPIKPTTWIHTTAKDVALIRTLWETRRYLSQRKV